MKTKIYTDSELAKLFKVDRTTIFRWRKLGLPNNDSELAFAWVKNYKLNSHPGVATVAEGIGSDVVPIAVKGDTAYDVRDRLQAEEQKI